MKSQKLLSVDDPCSFLHWAERIRDRSLIKSSATKEQVRYCLDFFLIPFFGKLAITEIDEHAIFEFTRWVETLKRKPWTHLKQLKKILTYAHRKGAISAFPDFDMEVEFPFREGHYLTRSDLARLMRKASRDLRLQMFLSYRHSFRKREVFSIMRDASLLEHGVVVIRSKTAKTRRKRIVPLCAAAARILRARFNRAPKAIYLFPSKDGMGHIRSNRTAMRRALVRAGLPKTIRFPDLRKTFASNALNSGFPIELVSRVGGFSPKTIRDHYYIVDDTDARRMVNALHRRGDR
jgi:integrase